MSFQFPEVLKKGTKTTAIIFALVLLFYTIPSKAQTPADSIARDTLIVLKEQKSQLDSLADKTNDTLKQRKAHKALLWSLLPGGGQIYNRQIWKAPVFAGGVGGLSVWAIQSKQRFKRKQSEYISLLQTDGLDSPLAAQARLQKDRAKRRYNAAFAGVWVVYGVNLLDAFASAHVLNGKVKHSPIKAAYYSAIMPGLGQIYNRKYWKLPIVYAGFGATGGFVWYNAKRYKRYRTEILTRTHVGYGTPDPELESRSLDQMVSLKNSALGDLELSVLIMSLWYVLGILDASIDAHLQNFDISDDLSWSAQPFVTFQSLTPTPLPDLASPIGGLQFNFSF